MNAQKTMMLLGTVGFLACLGVLLFKTYKFDHLWNSTASMYADAIVVKEALPQLQVIARPSQIAINLPGDVFFFASNDSSLTLKAQQQLRALAETVGKMYAEYELRVVGHTDSRGEADYNKRLGQRRAESVADFLVANGLKASWVQAMSMGEQAPLATNQTDPGRARNRRVEVQVVPIKKPDRAEGPTDGDRNQWIDSFVKVLQTNPVFVALGTLSSLVTILSWLVGFLRGEHRRRIA